MKGMVQRVKKYFSFTGNPANQKGIPAAIMEINPKTRIFDEHLYFSLLTSLFDEIPKKVTNAIKVTTINPKYIKIIL